jgi:hypothetical protein
MVVTTLITLISSRIRGFARTAIKRYEAEANFKIIYDTAEKQPTKLAGADVVVVLDTLEHIPEHVVIDFMTLRRHRGALCCLSSRHADRYGGRDCGVHVPRADA